MTLDPDIQIPILSEPDKDGMQTLLGYEPGYHVNIALQDLTPELEAFRVFPSQLRRVFAGDDPEKPAWTVALKFEEEAEARKVLGLPS
jgi:hypothetical protein